MGPALKPDAGLAARVLPAPLHAALRHVFAQGVSDAVLVGGTALAGYYAGHRRSDDIDLFVRDEDAHRAAVLAVESLTRRGAELASQTRTAQYYRALASLDGHAFTVDVAVHGGLWEPADSARASDGVRVASLESLTALKGAALLSRCSEKDLYDLSWLLANRPGLDAAGLAAAAARVDAGANPESFLISLSGAGLSAAACSFAADQGVAAAEAFREVTALRKSLLKDFKALAAAAPAPAIAPLIARLRKLKGK